MIQKIIFDVLGITGLLMLAYGLWLISPVYMFVIIGALFVLAAYLASRKRGAPRKSKG